MTSQASPEFPQTDLQERRHRPTQGCAKAEGGRQEGLGNQDCAPQGAGIKGPVYSLHGGTQCELNGLRCVGAALAIMGGLEGP